MRLNAEELVCLGSILKAAQVAAEEEEKQEEETQPELKVAPKEEPKKEEPKKKAKKKKKRVLPSAYPDYAKSLVTQNRRDPMASGLMRGAGTGTLGAILGALVTRIATADPKKVGIGAGAGAALGAVPGFISGRNEALSDYSRLLFLRRLGVRRPGELEALIRYPETTEDITEEGVQI